MSKMSYASGDIFNKIKEAADGRNLLQLTYIDAKGKPSIRTVEPYEIKNETLYAHCTVKDALRTFKLDQIQSAEVHIVEFEPRFPILI